MIGVDIVKVERIKRAVERWGERFLSRVYSREEINYCMRKKNPYPSLAARFALKEAFYKATGGKTSFHDISYTQKPRLTPHAEKILQGKSFSLSLSHDGEYAIAVVEII
ncbi:holo-[acyl-carrier-protein] synthase [bacterium]|nr:MAG: holo-[acyl-carrier-protein] synthase [bacterium]